MTFDKVLSALGECERVIREHSTYRIPRSVDAERREQLDHCLNMIAAVRVWPPERIEKAFRWLGFIQGVLYAHGLATIDQLKAMSRPGV